MNSVLTAMDDRIAQATACVATHRDQLISAQALRTQLAKERQLASGRLAAGEASAAPDLDRLLAELVDAGHAQQDAENALRAAQLAVPPLQADRARAAETEITAHLLPLVAEVRPALARAITAQVETLVATVRMYNAIVEESTGLAGLRPARPNSILPHKTMEPFVARAIFRALQRALPSQSLGVSMFEDPLPELDLQITRGLREALARE
jgi:hypothetical protein